MVLRMASNPYHLNQTNILFSNHAIQGGTALYCNAEFKSLINENNLSGLSFNSDLVSIFA